MAHNLRVLISDTTNPWFNLATEDWIFRELDPDTRTLFLWRNADTVVIGRHQNPWVECKVGKMEEDGIYLARRQSGGGAVFHDTGNTNFTFLSSSDAYSQEENFQIIIDALASFGISAERSGRNDILVQDRKISGSAFKHTRERSFHHGTLLINADLGRLQDYLNPSAKKLVSKGIKSVRSRVANLTEFAADLDHSTVTQAVMERFFEHYGSRCEPELLDAASLREIPSLQAYYDQMADWEWRFGKTPEFSHHLEEQFSWGGIDLHINVEHGVIRACTIFSDALDPEMIDSLQRVLPDVRYRREDVAAAIDGVVTRHPDRSSELNELSQWLTEAMG
ncbi:MAG TPA: lipoate--protein ligase [Alkalispirochaeta sp.]|nr:lipoate--protein ligase [Alkalispirochaeta sp.]